VCGKKEGLNFCSGCLQRQYCSPKCQKEAWKEHKPVCNAYKAVGLDLTDPEQVANKLMEYAKQLGDSNLCESQLRVSTEVLAFCKVSEVNIECTMTALANLSVNLCTMSRFSEAEIFAREMVAELEKETPIQGMHMYASENLSCVLMLQANFEEARSVAHDAITRFLPLLPEAEGGAMVRLMEAEVSALEGLGRNQEALDLAQHCLKTRTDHPERFPDGGKVPFNSFFALGASLRRAGRLEEAESTYKKGLAGLESEGKVLHPDVVVGMGALVEVFHRQGREKEAWKMAKAIQKLVPQVYPKDHPQYKKYMGQ
jgi:tetratricopeptide (TPR) repeat protein